jgi:hypothetical protein
MLSKQQQQQKMTPKKSCHPEQVEGKIFCSQRKEKKTKQSIMAF